MTLILPNFMQYGKKPLVNVVVDEKNNKLTLPVPMAGKGPEMWANLFTRVFSRNHLKEWSKGIPMYECPCATFYSEWLINNPPSFPLTFEWKHRLKTAVNQKLSHPTLDLETARHIWRQTNSINKPRNVNVVSSISPNNVNRQVKSIETWITSGFNVILLQTNNEIKAYKYLLPRVEFIKCTTERPLIKEMAKYGIIINSDCEMYGEGPDNIEHNNFYLRWNYREGRASREEEWGIDACYIDPDILPDDFDFMIGKPFWDYAVPAILINKDLFIKINHIPWLHHLKHTLNWSQDDWHKGHEWVTKRFEGDYSSPTYRASLDPEHTYNKQLGMWVRK